MSVAVIIPAYNEAERLPVVLRALLQARDLWDELVVVDDGSADGTYAAAQKFPEVRALRLPANKGKGGAMWAGVQATSADVVCFLDADLQGLGREHLEALVAPVRDGRTEMTVGLFRGGRAKTDFSHHITPWVSGQRAILRRRLLEVPEIDDSRLGVEAALTRAAYHHGWETLYVPWRGVTHTMKEEKLGRVRGFIARLGMYREMARAALSPMKEETTPGPLTAPAPTGPAS